MKITLRQMEVFAAIARHGQVTRAADEVALTQAAASMALADLERQLDVRLFDRVGRRLHLSQIGRALLPQVLGVLDRAREIESLGVGVDAAPSLALGASMTIGNYLLPPLLAELRRRHPAAEVRLGIHNSATIEADLLAFRIDLGFVEGGVISPRLRAVPWRQDKLCVFAAPDHPLAATGTLDPGAARTAEWVLREPGSGTRAVFERAFAGLSAVPRVVLEFAQPEAIRQAVRAGAGLGCLPEVTLADAFEGGWLVPLATPFFDLTRVLKVVRHQDKYLSAGLRTMLGLCGIEPAEGVPG
ncbi:LysR family transcriptional regulator [Nitrogeniibacter mangrovi]|uniref:LysR family transcriptional regulator n=1 Tax=Nitrogeniibacter mangrovi TaxID=2016596 RepID=A0A6C1B893_9RHOO|nr:LysR substrate-binding domain-containing protein [Nitrogeniibacter mangrovi]QID18464.1 LysR family transcriptional regulator [Nitrogeniibacter mangrovi]